MSGDGYDEARRIGAIVRDLRACMGMTLDEVAERAGFSKSHVWELEKGRGRDVTVRAIRALARCFGVSVVTFLADTDCDPALHPEALRIAIQVDEALRKAERR
mgnify:CR=1 FL=1